MSELPIICPNQIPHVNGKVRCALAPAVRFPADGPHHRCSGCRDEWTDDTPPTSETPTPTVVALQTIASGDGPKPREPVDVRQARHRNRRRPHHCEYGGRLLKTGKTCADKWYACDKYGEINCRVCETCEDFEAIVP